jgi:hypothetical protein
LHLFPVAIFLYLPPVPVSAIPPSLVETDRFPLTLGRISDWAIEIQQHDNIGFWQAKSATK